jgi:hypothetical protein
MQTREYPEVPPDFGHWLAGFIDGEGCFYIVNYKHTREGGYRMCFCINLRSDDVAILQQCAAVTGLGRLKARANRDSSRLGTRPGMEWIVGRKTDCRRLVELLDRYPLRAKKARDYAIWREAVLLWVDLTQPRGQRRVRAEWGRIPVLREQLAAVRAYAAA